VARHHGRPFHRPASHHLPPDNAAHRGSDRAARPASRAPAMVVEFIGFYMIAQLDLRHRFADSAFRWMHVMVGVWSLFAFVLPVGETATEAQK
jgi:hypothetical protein